MVLRDSFDLEAADLAGTINDLTPCEAATVADVPVRGPSKSPTMRRRAAILEQLEVPRVAGSSLDWRPTADLASCEDAAARTPNYSKPVLRFARNSKTCCIQPTPAGDHDDGVCRTDPTMTLLLRSNTFAPWLGEKSRRHACYILDLKQNICWVVSLRGPGDGRVGRPYESDARQAGPVKSSNDQETVAQKIGKYNLLAVPVLEEGGASWAL